MICDGGNQGCAIVREMDNVCKALPCGEVLQHCFLIGNGIALTLLVIIFTKVITAQSQATHLQ